MSSELRDSIKRAAPAPRQALDERESCRDERADSLRRGHVPS